jgi:hypothetical protein
LLPPAGARLFVIKGEIMTGSLSRKITLNGWTKTSVLLHMRQTK